MRVKEPTPLIFLMLLLRMMNPTEYKTGCETNSFNIFERIFKKFENFNDKQSVVSNILKQHGSSITSGRKEVLSILMNSSRALSWSDISKSL